ncbi:MAG: TatD family hydrolase [Deltaproteobacteria bacterium]|nr:TatD family hydrolase [Deltaproteobacteria bacterium]
MNTPHPRLIDIGANLTNKAFHADLPQVLARARKVGVTTIVITGTSLPESTAAAALAQSHGHYATAGVHPHHAKDTTPGFSEDLRALLQQPSVVAVGECGLDYDRDFSPRDVQRACFEEQLVLAAHTNKPVFLHERAAHDDFLAIVRRHRDTLSNAVVHCFTGTSAELDAYLDLDLHIGITGWICDERRGGHLRALMPRIPANRLMLETDAPYLLPKNLPAAPKSRRNEPAFLPMVLSTVAQARHETPEALAATTTATAQAFFALTAS